MTGIPSYVTHYYLGDRRPFLNLSDLEHDERTTVMQELIAMRKAGQQRRSFGQRYAQWRQLTEERLRDLFVDAGGQPDRRVPHYFVLGESRWFLSLATDMQSLSLPLTSLPAEATSFTMQDSFIAMGFGPQFGFAHPTEPHERHVYKFGQLEEVIRRHGLPPGDDERLVEVQLWTDTPVSEWLSQ